MADLGFETVEEMVGQVDCLRQRDDVKQEKARKLDLSAVLAEPAGGGRTKTEPQTHDVDEALDHELIEAATSALDGGEPLRLDADIGNHHRAVGAMLSYEVSKRYGTPGLPEDSVVVDFDGVAGQSFGAFLQDGVSFHLTGTANDYVGKGLSGGKLVVETPAEAAFEPTENVVVGNVALYGATQGELYVNGRAGERFGVRNSGVKAVVEGVGDHGCEYMTGGVVAVLGDTGKNFAAGMSGGVAYVFDGDGEFREKANTGMVTLSDDLEERDRRMLRRLVENHRDYTDSERAAEVLDDWEAALSDVVKVMPDAYSRVLDELDADDVRTDLPEPATSAVGDDAEPLRGGAD
jgi:glutamate synthase (NADPH/NADH) large chain